MYQPSSPHDPLAAARALAPRVAACSAAIEHERRLPPALVAALADAGLFRLLLPSSVGGGEVTPRTFVEVVETIAGADASAGWCLSQANGCATIAAYMGPAAAREVFGGRGGILAWGPPNEARAVAVAGGYRVSGRWAFASGCRHATWLGPACPVIEADGTPRRLPDGGPEVRNCLVPAGAARFEDIWHVAGLRGTASDAFTLDEVFVPHERAPRYAVAERREGGALYRLPLWGFYGPGFAAVALGIARAMLDAFIALAGAKTPRGTGGVLRENTNMQAQVARAEAAWRGARAFLHSALDAAWDAAQDGDIPPAHLANLRLAATDAIHRAARVADRAYALAGATAIFENGPFARRLRDIQAVRQQVQGREAHYEAAGRFFLGLDPEGARL